MAIILPSIAFAIPLSVLVLSNFIRDIPRELFESMRLDGASDWGTLWHLAFPLTHPALVTVTIYNGLIIWNGFLLPLILTQSPSSGRCRWRCGRSRGSTASTSRRCSPRWC
jgi:raffinose/stachyose/melibiose transport system permease protein